MGGGVVSSAFGSFVRTWRNRKQNTKQSQLRRQGCGPDPTARHSYTGVSHFRRQQWPPRHKEAQSRRKPRTLRSAGQLDDGQYDSQLSTTTPITTRWCASAMVDAFGLHGSTTTTDNPARPVIQRQSFLVSTSDDWIRLDGRRRIGGPARTTSACGNVWGWTTHQTPDATTIDRNNKDSIRSC